ncbi:MAG: DUF4270 family protein, partial [Bacteroidetes bacterium]
MKKYLSLLKKSPINLLIFDLRLRKNSIAFFFIAFLFLTACKKKDDIILKDTQPLTGNSQLQHTSLTLKAQTVYDTLQNTSKTDNILLGNYYDPVTGVHKSSAFFQMYFSELPSFSDTSTIVIDSAQLLMEVNLVYGKNATAQNFSLFPLLEKLYTDSSYSISDSLPVSSQAISSQTAYTDLSSVNYLSFNIDSNFARKILFAPTAGYSDASSFLDYIKGFYISSETYPAFDDGAVYHISPYGSNSKIII